ADQLATGRGDDAAEHEAGLGLGHAQLPLHADEEVVEAARPGSVDPQLEVEPAGDVDGLLDLRPRGQLLLQLRGIRGGCQADVVTCSLPKSDGTPAAPPRAAIPLVRRAGEARARRRLDRLIPRLNRRHGTPNTDTS